MARGLAEPVDPGMTRSSITTVIFACVQNAGRSQMAAAFFNELSDPTVARAISGGTQPADRVHPEVIDVMREVGLELSAAKPHLLTTMLTAGARLLITMGCGESCPVVPGLKVQDWQIEDPNGQSLERVRRIREEIKGRVEHLISAEGWSRESTRNTS